MEEKVTGHDGCAAALGSDLAPSCGPRLSDALVITPSESPMLPSDETGFPFRRGQQA